MRPICSVRAAGHVTAFGFAIAIPVSGVGGEVGVNCPRIRWDRADFAPGLAFGYLRGQSEHGLAYQSFTFGPEFEVSPAGFDRFKVGAGAGIELVEFARATNGGDIWFGNIQLNVRFTIDLVQMDRFALWLGAGARLGASLENAELSLAPLAQLGLRI